MSDMRGTLEGTLSRRRFLARISQLGLVAGLGASCAPLLSGCAQSEAPAPAAPKTTPAVPAATASAPAQASAITIRMGNLYAVDHFEEQTARKWAELIAQKTSGKMQLQTFPNMQLGNEQEMTEQVRQGALDILNAGGAIQNLVPELTVLGLPGLMRGPDQFKKAMWGDVGKKLAQATLDKTGIRVLGWTINGTRVFFHRSKQVKKTSEFSGVKIRVDNMPASSAIWKSVGASPVPMAWSEVFTSLQTGVVDAAEGPPSVIYPAKLNEVAKYITRTNHQLTVFAIMMNDKRYQSLPADVRNGFDAATQEYVGIRTQAAFDADATALDKLKQLGMQVNDLDDSDAFWNAMQPIYTDFADKYKIGDFISAFKALQ